MEKPQDCPRNNLPIMHPVCLFCCLICVFFRYTPRLNPHFQLPLDHGLIELHMALRCKHSLLNIDALNASMIACAPYMHLRAIGEQVCSCDRGRVNDVVEVHLVQVNAVFGLGECEELAAYVSEDNG